MKFLAYSLYSPIKKGSYYDSVQTSYSINNHLKIWYLVVYLNYIACRVHDLTSYISKVVRKFKILYFAKDGHALSRSYPLEARSNCSPLKSYKALISTLFLSWCNHIDWG